MVFLGTHFTSPLSAGIFGCTDAEKHKDMTILETVLAKMFTRKVVHKDLRNVLVKFENFCIKTFSDYTSFGALLRICF